MTSERPLSKARLHQILDRYDQGVTMEMRGGYDMGVYFLFTGRSLRKVDVEDRIVGGRLTNDHGFCSEALIMTRAERFSRGGSNHGVALFFARCAEREKRLARWLADYDEDRKKGKPR